MTEKQGCTFCGADGHFAAQCKWGETAKLVFVNGKPAKCGCQVEYSSGGGEYSDVVYVSPCQQHSGRVLELVTENRIALTPEYEGQWHADLYLDQEAPLAKAEGRTPIEAILAAINAEPAVRSGKIADRLELTEDLKNILGRPNFTCTHLAEALRQMDYVIERKSEAEQAACLHWMLNHYLAHGADWKVHAEAELKAATAQGGE